MYPLFGCFLNSVAAYLLCVAVDVSRKFTKQPWHVNIMIEEQTITKGRPRDLSLSHATS